MGARMCEEEEEDRGRSSKPLIDRMGGSFTSNIALWADNEDVGVRVACFVKADEEEDKSARCRSTARALSGGGFRSVAS